MTKIWESGIEYKFNETVIFEGKEYICLLDHISIKPWKPNVTPMLWREKGSNVIYEPDILFDLE